MTVPVFAYGETVTLVSRVASGQDDYGNDIYEEQSTSYDHVPVWQTDSSELVQGEDLTISHMTALLPAGVDVTAVDKVQIGGTDYEVEGKPWSPASPWTGLQPGVVVRLQEVTG